MPSPLRYSPPPHGDQQKYVRAVLPLLAWLCGITVALSLRYGYYGNRNLVVGPNSSRMVEASSVFVEQIQVSDASERAKGALLYRFSERPELSWETNWTASHQMFIDSYGRQGFSVWLNKGSKIKMGWEVEYGGGDYGDMLVVLIKGEYNFEELKRYYISSYIDVKGSGDGSREAEYNIDEDNIYYIGIVNLNSRSITTTLKVDVLSKMYDTSKATSVCSTSKGPCNTNLLFPKTHYFVLTMPNDVPATAWYVELSFVARLFAYFVIIGVVVIIVYIILNHLGASDSEETVEEAPAETETNPILPIKDLPCTYGTIEEDPESSLCCSSEDLYDGKICAICYDERRNCFFTPCGHNATCYTCAQRIMKEENKLCPICRRLIHKTRRINSP